ncbi:mechanosensitive ion channel family protein [Paraburkholderia fungorum]|uniref:mechanosensitive ion channel family protein n=1 Tax=Paraburkholderia fungorum TaxID=134537 RepID=UPI00402B359B
MLPLHFEPALLISAVHYLLHILAALLIVVVGWWTSNRIASLFLRAFSHTHADPTLAPMLKSMSAWSVRLLVGVAALNEVGIATASVLAVLGAAGLAIGLALQGTLQNIAAGMMLLLLRPFRAGDLIEGTGATAGIVREVGLFTTHVERTDGNAVFVPNSQIWSNPVINYSNGGTRRIEIEVDLTEHADVDGAIAELRTLVDKEPRVLKGETLAPVVAVSAYPRSGGVRLRVSAWVKEADPHHVQNDLRLHVHRTLSQAGMLCLQTAHASGPVSPMA